MADLEFSRAGDNLIMCAVLTTEGMEWVDENVATDQWQWTGESFAVEPRYAAQLAIAAADAGLEVS